MTGYGRGVAEGASRRISIELRSVNHRYLDIKMRSGVAAEIEDRISSRIRTVLQRGAISVSVRIEGGDIASARLDESAASEVFLQLTNLAKRLNVPGPTLDHVLAWPNVWATSDSSQNEEFEKALTEAVDMALAQMQAMRKTEGKTLAVDLNKRVVTLTQHCDVMQHHALISPEEAKRRLVERIERLLANSKVSVDENRLAQEIALLADRLDVTEELVRAKSHIAQLQQLFSANADTVGRKIDFLLQELGREFNTIASKSQSAEIARAVVDAKSELEKIREQVQNIE